MPAARLRLAAAPTGQRATLQVKRVLACLIACQSRRMAVRAVQRVFDQCQTIAYDRWHRGRILKGRQPMAYSRTYRRPAAVRASGPRGNKYDAGCASCGRTVPAGTGVLTGSRAAGWTVTHAPRRWFALPARGQVRRRVRGSHRSARMGCAGGACQLRVPRHAQRARTVRRCPVLRVL